MNEARTSTRAARGDADVAVVARLIGDPHRATILMALADGRAQPASKLAAAAGLRPSAATSHLHQLVRGGLVRVEQVGRFRLHSLAGPDVAHLVEALAALAPPKQVSSLGGSTKVAALREARSCYDHAAGRLGVAMSDALRAHGAVEFDDPLGGATAGSSTARVQFGPRAREVFGALDVDVAGIARTGARRPPMRLCVDWSERRCHLAGALGAALLESCLSHQWLIRRSGRALQLTVTGRAHLYDVLPTLRLDAQ